MEETDQDMETLTQKYLTLAPKVKVGHRVTHRQSRNLFGCFPINLLCRGVLWNALPSVFSLCYILRQDVEQQLKVEQSEKTKYKLETERLRAELNERRRQCEVLEQVRERRVSTYITAPSGKRRVTLCDVLLLVFAWTASEEAEGSVLGAGATSHRLRDSQQGVREQGAAVERPQVGDATRRDPPVDKPPLRYVVGL